MADLENMTDEELMKLENAPEADDDSEEAFSRSSGSVLEDELEVSAQDGSGNEEADGDDTVEADAPTDAEAAELENADDEGHTTPDHSEEEVETDQAEEADGTDDGSLDPKLTEDDTGSEEEPEDPEEETDTDDAAEETFDYKAAYEKVMGTFKANGREMKAETPEEAIQLMQQGANYVKKMQALKPNLKMLKMLENNGLLKEEKINFLIDVSRKDNDAIKKLLKDANIDPMDLDTSEESNYRPRNHNVSDQEMAFHDVLGDVLSNPTGQETVSLINDNWDSKSKEAVYKEPEIMKVIDEQRGNGIYDRISTEIERQQALGNLSYNVPFLEAYKAVGDMLHNAGKLVPQQSEQGQPQGQPNAPQQQTQQPSKSVGSRPSRRNVASNNDRARAASPSRSTQSQSPRKEFDPFEMTDEEIMAATSPRI